jgi:hypothetical protein
MLTLIRTLSRLVASSRRFSEQRHPSTRARINVEALEGKLLLSTLGIHHNGGGVDARLFERTAVVTTVPATTAALSASPAGSTLLFSSGFAGRTIPSSGIQARPVITATTVSVPASQATAAATTSRYSRPVITVNASESLATGLHPFGSAALSSLRGKKVVISATDVQISTGSLGSNALQNPMVSAHRR